MTLGYQRGDLLSVLTAEEDVNRHSGHDEPHLFRATDIAERCFEKFRVMDGRVEDATTLEVVALEALSDA
jgi:hypothetical protein